MTEEAKAESVKIDATVGDKKREEAGYGEFA